MQLAHQRPRHLDVHAAADAAADAMVLQVDELVRRLQQERRVTFDEEAEITARMNDGTGAHVNVSAGMISPTKVFEVLPNLQATSNDETLKFPQEERAHKLHNDMSADFRGIMDEMKNINTEVPSPPP